MDDLTSFPQALSEKNIKIAMIGTRTGFKSTEQSLHYEDYKDLGRDDYYQESREQQPLNVRFRKNIINSIDDILQNHKKTHEVASSVYDKIPIGTGFEYKGYTSAQDVTDAAVRWIKNNRNSDFFLWIHYMEGHRPYGVHNPEPKYAENISDEEIRKLMKKSGENPDNVTIKEYKLMVDLYDSDLRYCSNHIRSLANDISDLGLWEKTNFIFTSDHGEEFYDHQDFYHRNLPYDELTHVPLIVRSPEKESMQVNSQRELLDLAPTILDFHDINPPDIYKGSNLFDDIQRKVIIIGSQSTTGQVIGARWDGYKYIWKDGDDLLFDLQSDPLEEHNIARNNRDIVDKYKSEIPESYFESEGEEIREPDSTVDEKKLEALGYLEVNDNE
jgi:arylsulfatase A-like enzyme